MKYFKPHEFNCKCGGCGMGIREMNPRLLTMLERARGVAGVRFILTSAFRCPRHNKAVGGSPLSSHLKGLAVDIACESSHERWLIITGLFTAGFKRMGIGQDFIHVDIDPDKPGGCAWTYQGE